MPYQKLSWARRYARLPRFLQTILGCAVLLFAISLCLTVTLWCAVLITPLPSSSSGVRTAPTPMSTPLFRAKQDAPKKKVAGTPTHSASVTLTPTPTPTPTPLANNPWGYSLHYGTLIYQPPDAFCSYFTCVETFWQHTRGYVARCMNGEYTHSGGIRGACSQQGGVDQALYAH